MLHCNHVCLIIAPYSVAKAVCTTCVRMIETSTIQASNHKRIGLLEQPSLSAMSVLVDVGCDVTHSAGYGAYSKADPWVTASQPRG